MSAGGPAQPGRTRGGQAALPRRRFLRAGTAGSLGLAAAVAEAGALQYVWPRRVPGFGTAVRVPAARVPPPGADPVLIREGRFWLVNLRPEAGRNASRGTGGRSGRLLALDQRCPHLTCTVPWRPDRAWEGLKGWFVCPCHGAIFDRAGILVYGPSPRSMDTMRLTVEPGGSVVVRTGHIIPGAADNPRRAVPWSPPDGKRRNVP